MAIKVTRTPKSILIWNNVKDKLPDADIEVMIGTDSGDIYLGYYDDQDGAWIVPAFGSASTVAWWAELPEVPQ